jgi:hypothetical protein
MTTGFVARASTDAVRTDSDAGNAKVDEAAAAIERLVRS